MDQEILSEKIDLEQLFILRVEARKELRSSYSPLALCRAIKAGVPGSLLRRLINSIPKKIVMASLDLATEDYSKLVRRKTLTLNQTDNLNELTKIWAELRMLFNFDESSLKEWVDEELPILEGTKVRDLIVTNAGRALTRELVSEMLSGELA